jgi:hypothetical protein
VPWNTDAGPPRCRETTTRDRLGAVQWLRGTILVPFFHAAGPFWCGTVLLATTLPLSLATGARRCRTSVSRKRCHSSVLRDHRSFVSTLPRLIFFFFNFRCYQRNHCFLFFSLHLSCRPRFSFRMTQKRSVGPWASEVICGPILLPWAEANPPDATRAAPFRHTILVRFVRLLLLLLRRCRPRLASPPSRRSRQRRRQPAGVCCVLRILARRWASMAMLILISLYPRCFFRIRVSPSFSSRSGSSFSLCTFCVSPCNNNSNSLICSQ